MAKLDAKPPQPVVNVEAPAAPVDAMDADVHADGEDWAAEMETEDASQGAAIAAGTPAANPWAGMASFASMVRA